MARQYNDPLNGQPSSIGNQLRTEYFQRKALIEAAKEQYFGQLANVTSMPKHMGKKIKKYHYLPLLDDANINDQGIDANGVTIDSSKFVVKFYGLVKSFDAEADATAAAAAINAIEAATAVKAGSGPYTVTVSKAETIPTTEALAKAAAEAFGNATVTRCSGNLYGSSKDVGTIVGKLPVLSETGGRVNRVGFKRKEIEGSIAKFGIFDEYTQESLDFDSDDELEMHIHREMINGANEITEDLLQIDLLNAAGIVRFAGDALDDDELDDDDVVTYRDLLQLSIDLDNNRTPKHTKIITGSRMVDTKTLPAARVLYIGSELLPTLMAMKDLHGNPAFIPVQHYASAGTTLRGEVGAIDQFRIVVVPEMMKWAGAGAEAEDNATHFTTGGRFDVFPMLVVGDGAFSTIGFQTDGKTVKFKITHKKPGTETADRNDPYGETGFMSIKWWYGFLNERPERIGLIKTTAEM